jgi:mandelamide amidase
VRIPAALNGVCGLRPTAGRYPGEGVTPLSATRDTVGPIAHTVADLAALDAVIADDPTDVVEPDGVRLGIPTGLFTEPLGTATLAAFTQAVDILRSRGVTVVEVPVVGLDDVEDRVGLPIVCYEARRDLISYLSRYVPSVSLSQLTNSISGPDVSALFLDTIVDDAPNLVPVAAYQAALSDRERLRATYRDLFTTHGLDALIFPTAPRTAAPITDNPRFVAFGTETVPAFRLFIRNTGPGSIAGLPGLTIPIPVDGLPVGLALDGWLGTDRALLGVGSLVERLIG